MKIRMDRLSHIVTVSNLEKDDIVSMIFEKKTLQGKANKDGIVQIDCSKMISKHMRKEISIIIKQKNTNEKKFVEHIYEVRATKLILKKIVEVRKEK
jgi:hypothetical protein